MRIEAGEHAVDRGFDELAVVRLLDVIGAHPLEHVAEQIELAVGVGSRRFGARSDKDHVGLRREQREPGACHRAE